MPPIDGAMKFKLSKGYHAAEVAAGQSLYRLDDSNPVLETWHLDAIEALQSSPAVEEIPEKADDVIAQIKGASKQELKAIAHVDRRVSVQEACAAEREKRAADALAAAEPDLSYGELYPPAPEAEDEN